MKNFFFVFFIGVLLFSCVVAGEEGMSEKEALALFHRENPRVRMLEAKLESARAEALQAKLFANPEAGFRIEDAGSRDLFVEGSWPVDVSGRGWFKRRAAAKAVLSAENLNRWELNSLQCDLKIAFYSLLQAQQRFQVLQEGGRRLESVLNKARSHGGKADYDRTRLEKELADFKTDAAEARLHWIQSQREFLVLVSHSPQENFSVSGKLSPKVVIPDFHQLKQEVLPDHPRLQSLLAQVKQKKLERTAARLRWIPDLNVAGGFKSAKADGSQDSGYVASVTAQIPLFDNGQAERAKKNAELKEAQAEMEVARNEMGEGFEKDYQECLLTNQILTEYESAAFPHSQRLEQIAGLAYLEGELNTLELIDAYRGGTQARLRLLELGLKGREALIELERRVGRSLWE
jgi:outer membrane protein TolC